MAPEPESRDAVPGPAPEAAPAVASDGAADDADDAVPVLHAVTSDAIVLRDGFLAEAASVMRAVGRRGALQLRAPRLATRHLQQLAERLVPLQADTGAWLVICERVDVALVAGARGAQLTSRSMHPNDARRAAERAGSPIALGASVHAVAEARSAEAAGAQWVVAGHVFPTPSHAGVPGAGAGFVRDVAAAVRIPVVVIGGVTPADVAALRAAGAHGVAVIRGVWEASDAEQAATDYLASYDADAAPGRDDRPDGERRAARDG